MWGKKSPFGAGATAYPRAKERSWALSFRQTKKLTFPKWIKNLNAIAKSVNLLEHNIGLNLYNLGWGKGFLAIIPKAQIKKK